jgi:hypothetical protein
MDDQLHPMLAEQQVFEAAPQPRYQVHPSLQADLEETVEEVPDEVETAPVEQQVVEQAPVQEDPKERDWRQVRAKAEEARQLAREKEALERERDFYRQQAMNPQPKAQQQQEDEYLTDSERNLKSQIEELRQQQAKLARETEEAKRQTAVSRAEARLSQDFPDIKTVVSEENVERLKEQYPHLYNAAVASNDVYSVGAAAYEFIMAKGIYKKSKPTNPINQIVNNANASRPRSASIANPQAGESPIKQANAFMSQGRANTDEENKALFAEMLASSRNKGW